MFGPRSRINYDVIKDAVQFRAGHRAHIPPRLPLAALGLLVLFAACCLGPQAAPTPTAAKALVTSTPSPTRIARSVASPSPTARQGATPKPLYVFPVQPAKSTHYGPYHHDYPAVDIFCPIGSLFVAPTNGVVDFVSTRDTWNPKVDDPATRGGLSVAIIGDDGVRYYGSHLSSVSKGIVPAVRVKAGQALGRTGHSGDARYVTPHLHFGISPPTTPDDWKVRRGVVSPYKYLRAWQVGKQLRPVVR